MKIKVRSEYGSTFEVDEWIARLREDSGHSPPTPGSPKPQDIPAGPAPRSVPRVAITGRAPIGDQLRTPMAVCEMGSCISRYTDPAALGEADIRARAIAAGWRIDALGRLACPTCLQRAPGFWTAYPVTLWNRDAAVTMATLMAAGSAADGATDSEDMTHTGVLPVIRSTDYPPPTSRIRGRHRKHRRFD